MLRRWWSALRGCRRFRERFAESGAEKKTALRKESQSGAKNPNHVIETSITTLTVQVNLCNKGTAAGLQKTLNFKEVLLNNSMSLVLHVNIYWQKMQHLC